MVPNAVRVVLITRETTRKKGRERTMVKEKILSFTVAMIPPITGLGSIFHMMFNASLSSPIL
jgi:hypothetical protein